jgi:glutathione S-transferase
MRARLVTIPFSHYCEKARWALERAGIEYVEEPHVPMFAWAPALRAGRRQTVPVLVAGGEAFKDSHEILAWVDRRAPNAGLYPKDIAGDVAELESLFDRKVGPAARRLAYHALMKDPRAVRDLFLREARPWEAAATRALLPVMLRMVKRGLKIDDAGAARSETQLASALEEVEQRLAKSGGPWLFGERFTAADLTFASLMAPLIAPPAFADAHFPPSIIQTGAARTMVERHRETNAGRFVLRAYEEERAVRSPS